MLDKKCSCSNCKNFNEWYNNKLCNYYFYKTNFLSILLDIKYDPIYKGLYKKYNEKVFGIEYTLNNMLNIFEIDSYSYPSLKKNQLYNLVVKEEVAFEYLKNLIDKYIDNLMFE